MRAAFARRHREDARGRARGTAGRQRQRGIRARPCAAVMLTRVVGKGRVEPFELERDTRYTIVDVGTGDGHYAYALAAERPEARVVAFDALEEPMAEIAHRARRKPA